MAKPGRVTKSRDGGAHAFTAIDAYGGLRYWYFSNTLSLSFTGVVNVPAVGLEQAYGPAIARSGAMEWIDPVFDLRLRHQLSSGGEFQSRGDVGGSGVGSKFSWQLAGGYSHDVNLFGWTITSTIGYRAVSVDYSDGSGNSQKGIDAIIYGPVFATSFRF